ncbi:hypothetical protein HI914_01926 [Erysiphe necator]|nr:hypothetical protein HI914_01926 [Erysiphe necator]
MQHSPVQQVENLHSAWQVLCTTIPNLRIFIEDYWWIKEAEAKRSSQCVSKLISEKLRTSRLT